MRKLLLLLIVAGLVLLIGCGGGSSTASSGGSTNNGGQGQVTLQSIQINPSSASIAQGTTQAFTATGTYSDGSTKDITLTAEWSCLLSNLATVSSSAPTQGLATAVAPGTALITATMGGVSNSGTLTIKGGLNVTSLMVTPAKASIAFGNQQQFTATATFSDMTQQDVTNVSSWSASPLFITSNSGLATANNVGPGTMVQANFSGGGNGGGSGSATLNADLSNLVSISLLSPALMANDTKVQLSAIGTFTDGSTRDISNLATWSSSDPTIAIFIGSVLSAKLPGGPITISATACTVIDPITYACTGTMVTGSAMLTVTAATLNSIVVCPVNASIAPTTKLQMRAIGVFSDSSVQDMTTQVSWSVLDYSVAEVQTVKGLVTGLAAGSTMVTATSSGALGYIQGSTPLTVTSATLTSIALTPANTFISPGATLTYSAMGTFSDSTIQDISNASQWASDYLNVATVSLGTATGQGLGQSNVTAKLKLAGNTFVSSTTNLKVASPKQIAIAVAPASVQIAAQTSTQLTATGTFIDGSKQDLTSSVQWSSSSASVATVGGQTGIVSGLTPGKSTITATLGSASSTTQVTVTNATLSSVTLAPANPSIALGSTQQFTATGTFSDSTTQPLLGASWSSSSPAVAAVNPSGLASGTGVGTTTVTATLNGVSGITNLTVH